MFFLHANAKNKKKNEKQKLSAKTLRNLIWILLHATLNRCNLKWLNGLCRRLYCSLLLMLMLLPLYLDLFFVDFFSRTHLSFTYTFTHSFAFPQRVITSHVLKHSIVQFGLYNRFIFPNKKCSWSSPFSVFCSFFTRWNLIMTSSP